MSRQRRFIVLISAGSHVSPTSQAVSGNQPRKVTQPLTISAPQNRQSMPEHHIPVPGIGVGSSVQNGRCEIGWPKEYPFELDVRLVGRGHGDRIGPGGWGDHVVPEPEGEWSGVCRD